jgi:hypothetical protein
MKILCLAAASILFGCNISALSQSDVVCGQTLSSPLHSRSVLTVESRPAGLEFAASDDEMVHVTCSSSDADLAQHIHLKFSRSASDSKLVVDGGHINNHGNLKIRVEVPRKTNLQIRMPAGEVKIEDIVGDKDVEIHAGHILIASREVWRYKKLDLSVSIGSLNAPAYGVKDGGFLHTLKQETTDGEYRLHASVGTGEIELSGKAHGAGD